MSVKYITPVGNRILCDKDKSSLNMIVYVNNRKLQRSRRGIKFAVYDRRVVIKHKTLKICLKMFLTIAFKFVMLSNVLV